MISRVNRIHSSFFVLWPKIDTSTIGNVSEKANREKNLFTKEIQLSIAAGLAFSRSRRAFGGQECGRKYLLDQKLTQKAY
jgi:hypothetical protein